MTTPKAKSLQDTYLHALCKKDIQVSVYLVNGVMLQGKIEHFDQFVIVLLWNNIPQMIYKHAISTIVPARSIKLAHHDSRSHDNRARGEGDERGDAASE